MTTGLVNTHIDRSIANLASCKCWQVSIKESCCLRSFCVYESAENELKENNKGFGYLFDVKISRIFF